MGDSRDWSGMGIGSALNMATGFYRYPTYMTDEHLYQVQQDFFLVDTHADKLEHATSFYPQKDSPDSRFVYHSSDTYLATFALNEILKSKVGDADVDLYRRMYKDIYAPLGCSQIMRETKRTYDAAREPLGGFGLVFNSDDVVKVARFMNSQNGVIDGAQKVSAYELASAKQQHGYYRGTYVASASKGAESYFYKNGAWSVNLGAFTGCDAYIPYFDGFGGLKLVLFPNGAIYYFFTDDDSYVLLDALTEMLELRDARGRNYCDVITEIVAANGGEANPVVGGGQVKAVLDAENGLGKDATRKSVQFTFMLGLAVMLSSLVILGAICLLDDARMRKGVEIAYGMGAELDSSESEMALDEDDRDIVMISDAAPGFFGVSKYF